MTRTTTMLLCSAVFLWSKPLGVLLNEAQKSETLQESVYSLQSVQKGTQAIKESYKPSLSTSASLQKVYNKGPMDAGLNTTLSLDASWNLWDGGKKGALLEQSYANERQIFQQKEWTLKTLEHSIVTQYALYLQLQAQRHALISKQQKLRNELSRLDRFFSAGISSKENLEKIKASYEQSQSDIVNLDVSLEQVRLDLELLSGTSVDNGTFFTFVEPINSVGERNDIKGLEANYAQTLAHIQEINSRYLPSLSLHDSQSFYRYNDDSTGIQRVDNQNRLTLNIAMTLFDWGTKNAQKEQTTFQALALKERISYEKRKSQTQIRLAEKSLFLAKQQLIASQQLLNAASATFELIEQKYRAGLASTLDYLDALSQHSAALSSYEKAKIDVEMQKANIYYFNGVNLKEKLQ